MIWLLNTGFCPASEHHLLRGAPRRPARAHAVCALIEHPAHGLVLFDTGYAPRVSRAFGRFPFQIYGALTPTTTRREWTAASQLERLGFRVGDVKTVIVSHLHADHLGGLRDFPDARIVMSADALEISRLRGLAALRHAFMPALLPDDYERRVQVIRDFDDTPLAEFGGTHDLFADGSIRLLRLPGHARGQIGLWLPETQTLLAADGAYWSQSIRENRPPDRLPLALFFDDATASLETLSKLHRFQIARPTARIVPTHCPEFAALVSPGDLRLL